MSASEPDERIVDKRAASRIAAEGDGANEPEAGREADGVDERSELEIEREKAETYHRNWQRAAADFANYKRRIEQERSDSTRLANAALVLNLLPVFDDLDRAVGSIDPQIADSTWVTGVVNIHQKFARLLEAMGVTEVVAADTAFDPLQHEAIGNQPGEEGKILHVVQKGYALAGKVIRPAMVIVGSGGG